MLYPQYVASVSYALKNSILPFTQKQVEDESEGELRYEINIIIRLWFYEFPFVCFLLLLRRIHYSCHRLRRRSSIDGQAKTPKGTLVQLRQSKQRKSFVEARTDFSSEILSSLTLGILGLRRRAN